MNQKKNINEKFIYYSYSNNGIPYTTINNHLIEVYSNKKIDFLCFEKKIPEISIYGLLRQIEYITLITYDNSLIYMAPEEICYNNYNSKAHLWNIGKILYYIYFQEYPFDIPDFKAPNNIREKYNKNKKEIFKINIQMIQLINCQFIPHIKE